MYYMTQGLRPKINKKKIPKIIRFDIRNEQLKIIALNKNCPFQS